MFSRNARIMEDGTTTDATFDTNQGEILSEVAGFSIPQAPDGFKSGFIGIIGRPNVGKSTLMNQLVGQKIAITSPVAQTTRNRLRGILTTPEAQIIFVDTPGIHKPHHQLGEVLVKNAQIAINSVDVVLFVVDGSQEAGGGDRYIVDLLERTETPVILGLNKIDQQQSDSEWLDDSYTKLAEPHNWEIVKFSALTGDGMEGLQQVLCDRLETGPYYYPPDLVTDQPERFIMGELIREQILLLTREEVPHSVAVTIDRVEEEPTITRLLATIYVERPSQKGILIGKGGTMLKAIGSDARQQIQKLIAGKVYLELFVKVQPKWRQSRLHLLELGYRVEQE
ncbi:GTPase Era [Trichocoleus sp. FACHB-69]|uniref:GTPase Era n=1 Tax=Cyanophyceae TaxID=3028117 RepID=UPI0037DCFDE0